MITVLAGGTGAAKFLRGWIQVFPQKDTTVIVNVGDDIVHYGLHVSPDVDTILYCLAGVLSRRRGWGIGGDTFRCNSRLGSLGMANWFQVGDLDLATHIFRTWRLAEGDSLSEVTRELSEVYGVEAQVLPMSNEAVATRVMTDEGERAFQEYMVKFRAEPKVEAVRYDGAKDAEPAPGVLRAIAEAEAVIIAPSNPVTSIAPILAIKGVREALLNTQSKRLALSPFVGGKAVSGPAAALMRTWGFDPDPGGLARAYSQLIDSLVIDVVDRRWVDALGKMGVRAFVTRTVMAGPRDEVALARQTLRFLESLG